jgi:hypothetical protein
VPARGRVARLPRKSPGALRAAFPPHLQRLTDCCFAAEIKGLAALPGGFQRRARRLRRRERVWRIFQRVPFSRRPAYDGVSVDSSGPKGGSLNPFAKPLLDYSARPAKRAWLWRIIRVAAGLGLAALLIVGLRFREPFIQRLKVRRAVAACLTWRPPRGEPILVANVPEVTELLQSGAFIANNLLDPATAIRRIPPYEAFRGLCPPSRRPPASPLFVLELSRAGRPYLVAVDATYSASLTDATVIGVYASVIDPGGWNAEPTPVSGTDPLGRVLISKRKPVRILGAVVDPANASVAAFEYRVEGLGNGTIRFELRDDLSVSMVMSGPMAQ